MIKQQRLKLVLEVRRDGLLLIVVDVVDSNSNNMTIGILIRDLHLNLVSE